MQYVAIKLQGDGSLTPAQVINEHYRFATANNGKVYFSTDIRFNLQKRNKISTAILFFEIGQKDGVKMMYVRADIQSALNAKNCVKVSAQDGERIVPADSSQYSPERYRDELKRTWFLLENIQLVSESSLENLYTIGPYNITQKFTDVIKQERRNPRLYLTDEYTFREDDLISEAMLSLVGERESPL